MNDKLKANLKNRKIVFSDISILPAADVDIKLLQSFYETQYPQRADFLAQNWRWLNRASFYDDKIPLVVFYHGRIIAHAGMIPFNIFWDGKPYKASWFIDFSVLPEFQNQGLGKIIAKKWMEFSDVCLAAGCTESSKNLFKKLGWVEGFDSYLHYYFIQPFNHPRLAGLLPIALRKILNSLYQAFLPLDNSFADKTYLDRLDSKTIGKFISLDEQSGAVTAARDADYISWRLFSSPCKNDYRVFYGSGPAMIIKISQKSGIKYIDLLWTADLSDRSAVRRMILALAKWCRENDYAYIRYYTSGGKLSRYLRSYFGNITRRPAFLFYAKDAMLLNKLTQAEWNWQLIDSDWESV